MIKIRFINILLPPRHLAHTHTHTHIHLHTPIVAGKSEIHNDLTGWVWESG